MDELIRQEAAIAQQAQKYDYKVGKEVRPRASATGSMTASVMN